jgi:hypothetical protein
VVPKRPGLVVTLASIEVFSRPALLCAHRLVEGASANDAAPRSAWFVQNPVSDASVFLRPEFVAFVAVKPVAIAAYFTVMGADAIVTLATSAKIGQRFSTEMMGRALG